MNLDEAMKPENYMHELRHILGDRRYDELMAAPAEQRNSPEARAAVIDKLTEWIAYVKGEDDLEYFLDAVQTIIDAWDPEKGLVPGMIIHLDAEASVAFVKMLENAADTPEALEEAIEDYNEWRRRSTTQGKENSD
jgi:hypothetical protein